MAPRVVTGLTVGVGVGAIVVATVVKTGNVGLPVGRMVAVGVGVGVTVFPAWWDSPMV
jgi:hypothetical protein